jgi:hypothetical protein
MARNPDIRRDSPFRRCTAGIRPAHCQGAVQATTALAEGPPMTMNEKPAEYVAAVGRFLD